MPGGGDEEVLEFIRQGSGDQVIHTKTGTTVFPNTAVCAFDKASHQLSAKWRAVSIYAKTAFP